ncbi:MAG TPA: DUF692 family protein [Candidatus Sulfopaludibacter sp.]|nr:DUF692 family protein [Candidatus Sulfopaludibacter sp.]
MGILCNPSLPPYLRGHLESLNFVSLIPDTFWSDRGAGAPDRFQEIARYREIVDWLAPRVPLVVHGLGMSIGSAGLFDLDHLRQLRRWYDRYDFRWHSEHLSFARLPAPDGGEHNAGLALPVPYDAEVLDMINRRIAQVQRAIPAPFLLENNVYYAGIPDQEMNEPEFLNRLDCSLLLDLHNVYTNSINHGFDPLAFLAAVDLSKVLEIHIAGGNEIGGVYTDSHAGPCPEQMWELLDYATANAPNLLGVTFEFHESYYPLLNESGIDAQLAAARCIWEKHHIPCHS